MELIDQRIVQALHGMIFVDIYHYELLFSIVKQKSFPLLLREFLVFTGNFLVKEIDHALIIDRPTLEDRFLK